MVAAVEVAAGDLQVATDIVAAPRGVTLCIRDRQRASGGSRYACIICLRERKAINTHHFGGDVAGRQGVVALAFRSVMILYPLRRSQAYFVNIVPLMSKNTTIT